MVLLAKLHMLLFQLVVWLFIKVPIRSVSAFLKTCLAWLHMEVKRWLGVFVGGLIVLVIAQALIKASPPGSNWRWVALLICLLWLLALFSAARLTMEYLSLRRVRQSQAFREIHQMSQEAAKHAKAASTAAVSTAAKKTRGTPVEGVFSANRSARAEERAAAEQAREQAEVARLEHEEQVRLAAEQAAAETARAAEEERKRAAPLRRVVRPRSRLRRPVTTNMGNR